MPPARAVDPRTPCPFPAGSAEKSLVMAERARLQIDLFHPLDSTAPPARRQPFVGSHRASPGPLLERRQEQHNRYRRERRAREAREQGGG